MDSMLLDSLEKAGVRQNVVEILQEEELDTVNILQVSSDDLLKSCGIKGGQIVKIRNALVTCIHSQDEQGIITLKPSTPTTSRPSMPTNSRSSTPTTSGPSTPMSSGSSTTNSRPTNSRPTNSGPSSRPSSPKPSTYTPKPLALSNSTPPASSRQSPSTFLPPPPSVGSSPNSFAIKENGNLNKNWLKDFKLPSLFSTLVNEGLKAGELSGNRRDEFTRDICTAIKLHTLYPTKAEKNRVALMIVQAYPCLEDSIGAGPGSWSKAITNRFKNMRRKKTPERDASVKRPNINELPPVPKKRKVCSDLPQYGEGETEETCEEHVKVLKKEMAKTSNKNQTLVKELMDLTYPYRRQSLLLEPKGVDAILTEFPALRLVSEIKAEFDRILSERKIVRQMVENYRAVQQQILDVAAKSTNKNLKYIISGMKSMVSEEPNKKIDIESTASILALECILKEKTAKENMFFMICPEDQTIDEAVAGTTYPRLIGCGDLSALDPFVIAAEGQIFTTLSGAIIGVPWAVALLLGTFYILNIEYTRGVTNVYAFLEAIMLNRHEQAKKRISVQKFLKELDS